MEKEGIINFIKLIGNLKNIKRAGWMEKVGIKEPESIADHSFRTAILCMLFGDMKKLNTLKMLKMALIHDVCESIIGDLIHPKDEKEELRKRNLENNAMMKILSLLPKDIRRKYSKIWKEFQDGVSIEAKIVKEMDKLEMAFQALEYEEKGYSKEKLLEFWDTVENYISDYDAKIIFNILKRQSMGKQIS
ncbi:MAG: HD domain-containing protein [Nitrososphaerales archaeon]